jgi:hypothetical protein
MENEIYSVNQSLSNLSISLETLTRIHLASEMRLSGKIDRADNSIITLNDIYQKILEEHSKRRLESLYTDRYLVDRMLEASQLLEDGKINQAYVLYESIAREQHENRDARFYMYYTLFLRNKFDREEYPKIKAGFLKLENEGYIREEIREVLSFIKLEEGGAVIELQEEVDE